MILLHNIGDYRHCNYNTRDQVALSNGPITFDGIYLNVYENRDLLKGRDVILFIMGDYIGGDNSFDLQAAPDYGLKLEKFCTKEQLEELRDDFGCRLGWHTWTHQNLRHASEETIRKELTRPDWIEPLLAYPYGDFDDRVIRITQEMGYEDAWSVDQGNGGPFQRKRFYLV